MSYFGRPLDPIWGDHFTKSKQADGKILSKCSICQKVWSGTDVSRLKLHR